MLEDIVALFIPIVFLVGLFTAISLNVYFKYKTRTSTANHVPGESLGEWYKAEAQAKVATGRAAAFRVAGLLVGLGIGTAVGCLIINANGFISSPYFDRYAIATFLVIALAMFFGGLGMLGAWFLERRLDGKSK